MKSFVEGTLGEIKVPLRVPLMDLQNSGFRVQGSFKGTYSDAGFRVWLVFGVQGFRCFRSVGA